MHSALSFLALLGGSLAFPFPFSQSHGKTFSASVGRVDGGVPASFKHGNLHERATGRDAIAFSTYWYANVTAGGQNIILMLDTGSAVTWALSPNASASQTAGQALYDPSKSKTASRYPGETFDIRYGDGSAEVNGTVYNDTLCLGTACTTAPIAPANYVTGITAGSLKSGIMGLSFGAASQYTPTRLPTFMEALIKSLTLPIFTTNFRMDGTGWIDFGYVNSSLYTGALQPVTINNSSGAWNADNVGFAAGGKTLGTNMSMIFDTGSPIIQAQNGTVSAYHAQVTNASYYNNRWQYPCSVRGSLPAFQIRFASGSVATIPGNMMHWGALDSQGQNCTSWLQITGSTQGTIGDAFFNSQIVVFNQSVPALSFAPKSS